MTLYRQALAEAGDDVETRIEAEAGLAVAMMRMLDDLPTAARHARAAVGLAEAHAVGDALPEFKARQALIDALLGDPDALELARNAAELQHAADASGESGADYFARTLGGADFMRGVAPPMGGSSSKKAAPRSSPRASVFWSSGTRARCR